MEELDRLEGRTNWKSYLPAGARAYRWFCRHPVLAAFIGCVLIGLSIIGLAWASRRVNEFREKLAQGFASSTTVGPSSPES